MGVISFKGAVNEAGANSKRTPEELMPALTAGTRGILTTPGFGLFRDRFEEDVQNWYALSQIITQVMDTSLDETSPLSDWKQTAAAVATCYARAPATLGPRVEAHELYDAFTAKIEGHQDETDIRAFLDASIETFSLSQSPVHADVLEQKA